MKWIYMDCHALQSKARNDRKEALYKQDSRDCGGAVDFHRLQRILGFCDDFLKKPAAAAPCTAIAGFEGCRVQSKGAYLVYVTAVCAMTPSKARKSRIHQRKTMPKEHK